MITRFDSLFAGHVDMDNIGYAGTPVMERRFSDAELATAMDKTVAMAKVMDRTGYDTLFLAEHHFQPEGYEVLPNCLIMGLHIAHLTEQLKIGCGFNISPMWHPLRLAEDFAMVDYLTGGRMVFGLGRGYHTREVETFGAPLLDQPANRDLYEEQAEIIFKSFNEESFSHHGKNYDIPPDVPYRGGELKEISLTPRPLNRPVECYAPIQSGTKRSLDFMAKHGMKGIIGGGVAEGGAMQEVIEGFGEALVNAGRTDIERGTDITVGYHFHMGNTVEEATKEAASYFEENIKMFGPLRLVRGLSEQQMKDIADPKVAPTADLPRVEDAVSGGGYLCGPADYIIEKIKELEEAYPGMTRVNVSHPMGVPESMMLEHMEQFAEEVMPAFKNRVQEPALAD